MEEGVKELGPRPVRGSTSELLLVPLGKARRVIERSWTMGLTTAARKKDFAQAMMVGTEGTRTKQVSFDLSSPQSHSLPAF